MGYRGKSANFSRDSAFALDLMNTHFSLCNRLAIVIDASVVELATRDDGVRSPAAAH